MFAKKENSGKEPKYFADELRSIVRSGKLQDEQFAKQTAECYYDELKTDCKDAASERNTFIIFTRKFEDEDKRLLQRKKDLYELITNYLIEYCENELKLDAAVCKDTNHYNYIDDINIKVSWEN